MSLTCGFVSATLCVLPFEAAAGEATRSVRIVRGNQMNGNASTQRGVWLAIISTASLCVAVGTGLLFFMTGSEPTAVIGASGAAFLGSVGVGFAAHNFLAG